MALSIDNLYIDMNYQKLRPDKASELEQKLQAMIIESIDTFVQKKNTNSKKLMVLPDLNIELPCINFKQFSQNPQHYFNQYIRPKLQQTIELCFDSLDLSSIVNTGINGDWKRVRAMLLRSSQEVNSSQCVSLLINLIKQDSFSISRIKTWLLLPKVTHNVLASALDTQGATKLSDLFALLFPNINQKSHLQYFFQGAVAQHNKIAMWRDYLHFLIASDTCISADRHRALHLILKSYTLHVSAGINHAALNCALSQLRVLLAKTPTPKIVKSLSSCFNMAQYQGVTDKEITALNHCLAQEMTHLTAPVAQNLSAIIASLTTLFDHLKAIGECEEESVLLVLLKALRYWLANDTHLPVMYHTKARELLLLDDINEQHQEVFLLFWQLDTVAEQPIAEVGVVLNDLFVKILAHGSLPLQLYKDMTKFIKILASNYADQQGGMNSKLARLRKGLEQWREVLITHDITLGYSASITQNKKHRDCKKPIAQTTYQCVVEMITLLDKPLEQSRSSLLDMLRKMLSLDSFPASLSTQITQCRQRINQQSNHENPVELTQGLMTLQQGLKEWYAINMAEPSQSRNEVQHGFIARLHQVLGSIKGLLAITGQQSSLLKNEIEHGLLLLTFFKAKLPRKLRPLIKDFEKGRDVYSLNALYQALDIAIKSNRETLILEQEQHAQMRMSQSTSRIGSIYKIESEILMKTIDAIKVMLSRVSLEDKYNHSLSLFLYTIESIKVDIARSPSIASTLVQVLCNLLIIIDCALQQRSKSGPSWVLLRGQIVAQLDLLNECGGNNYKVSWWCIFIQEKAREALLSNAVLPSAHLEIDTTGELFPAILSATSLHLSAINTNEKIDANEEFKQFIQSLDNGLLEIRKIPIKTLINQKTLVDKLITWCDTQLVILESVALNEKQEDIVKRRLSDAVYDVKSDLYAVKNKSFVDGIEQSAFVAALPRKCLAHQVINMTELVLSQADTEYIDNTLRPISKQDEHLQQALVKFDEQTQKTDISKADAFSQELSQQISELSQIQADQVAHVESSDAGLLILWPYLNAFFSKFGLLVNHENGQNKFVDKQAQIKAHALLVNILGKTLSDATYAVANILVGFQLDVWIEQDIALNEQEKNECDLLIQGVIKNWSALKTMPVNSFKSLFITRNCLCESIEFGYKVVIENNPQDVLLSKLPWGLGTINLPWLDKQLIQVQWPYGI